MTPSRNPGKDTMNRIRAARQAIGWTQDELAMAAGVSPRTIHAVEQGRACRQTTKRLILNALSVAWEHRDDYFVSARRVRRVANQAQAPGALGA
jgi:DNA-binding XRE family transcriptional regulator